MANKKVKNVKELNREVETISVKIQVLEQTIKELKEIVNNKLEEIDKTLKNVQCKKDDVQCHKRNQRFETKKNLLNHMKENQQRYYKCKHCDFNSSILIDLERHTINQHGVKKVEMQQM